MPEKAERERVELQLLRRQIERLEGELRHERVARALAEASSRRAWSLGTWRRPPVDKPSQPGGG